MAEIKDYSTTAGSNNSASPNGMPENMAPSGVNDSWREGIARVKRWYEDISAINSLAGGTTAYTLAASRTISAYAAGDVFVSVCNATNTGTSTLNVDSVGAKDIYSNNGEAIGAGELVADGIYAFAYDATNDRFICLNPSREAMRVIASGTVSGSGTLSISGLSTTYSSYMLVFDNLQPSSDGANFRIRLGGNSGSTDYAWALDTDAEGEGGSEIGSAGDSKIDLFRSAGTGTGETLSGAITIFNPAASGVVNVNFRVSGQTSAPNFATFAGGGQLQAAEAVTTAELAFSTGSIATMTYTLYGMRA